MLWPRLHGPLGRDEAVNEVSFTAQDLIDHEAFASCTKEADDSITLEEVRAGTSTIKDSMARDVIRRGTRRALLMTRYFLDTSALVKHYHTELRTDAVDRIITAPGAELLIARLTLIETISSSPSRSAPGTSTL